MGQLSGNSMQPITPRSDFSVNAATGEATAQINGQNVTFNLTTSAGFQEFAAAAQATGYTLKGSLDAGDLALVPNDKLVSKAQEEAFLYATGGTSVRAKPSEPQVSNEDMQNIFANAGVAYPYDAQTTPRMQAQIQNSPLLQQQFDHAVLFTRKLFENPPEYGIPPGSPAYAQLREEINSLSPELSNVFEFVLLVLRAAMEEGFKEKAMQLTEIGKLNQISEALNESTREVGNLSKQLSEKEIGADDPSMVSLDTSFNVTTYDTKNLGPDGKPIPITHRGDTVTRTGIDAEYKNLAADSESVRNHRDERMTMFRSAEQKWNQTFDIASSLIKAIHQMDISVIKNFL